MSWQEEMKDLIWIVIDLDNPNKIEYGFEKRSEAIRLASNMVGNSAWTDTGEIVLFGPGDGTVSVMVRQYPRAQALREDVFIRPK